MEYSANPETGTPIPTPEMPFAARLTNVFIAPGDVFDQVRTGTRSVANWLVPTILSIMVGVVFVWVAFSQPDIQQNVRDQQTKKLQQMVAKGQITEAAMEQQQKQMAQADGFMMMIVKVAGSIGVVVVSWIWLFLLGLVLWLLGRWAFGARFGYLQAVEVVGLSGMIPLLGGIIGIPLVVLTGSLLATLGPSLLVSPLDPANKVHLILSSLNVVTLWYLGVLSAGLARLSGTSILKAGGWLFGLWLVLRLGIIFSGLGESGM